MRADRRLDVAPPARVASVSRSDVLVVGAGAAGLTAALGCAPLAVTVLTKARLGGGAASAWAQGGVASALGDDDAPMLHAADTLAAGAGLNDRAMVDLLTVEGPERVRALLELGARFDRDASGRLALGREAAHSRRRIVHAGGDSTGAEIVRALAATVRRAPEIRVVEEAFALDLVQEEPGGQVVGLSALGRDGSRVLHLASAVVLATGGCGRLYLYSTNPREATGDGLAMAARAGARLVDLEFMQFHPTALASSAVPGEPGDEPLPLLTEALRGEGAVLIDDRGRQFMAEEHPDAELAPRDVVARAIWRRLAAGGRVWLDARQAVGERFPERFPTVFALCRQRGIDPRTEPLPVTPAAHYHMGGIAADERGRTSLAGLWACGEVASTGVHGANRLASNSLLEALVFGARVAGDLRDGAGARLRGRGRTRPWRLLAGRGPAGPAAGMGVFASAAAASALAREIRILLWEKVGVERDEAGLASAVATLERLAEISRQCAAGSATAGEDAAPLPAASEARNILAVGRLVAAAALARRESRGGHFRRDFPRPDAGWQRRQVLTASADGSARFEAAVPATSAGAR